MLLSHKQTIEDHIIELLAFHGKLTGPELLVLIQERRGKTTKQAMYTVLGNFLEHEVIAKIGSKYYVSKLWIDKISSLLQIDNQQIEQESIFQLKDKESISYKFPSLLSCDTYWAHLFNILVEWVPRDIPIFVWNPHEWFIIGRNNEEKEIFKLLQKHRKKAFYSVAGNTSLDISFKKNCSNELLSININNELSFKQNYYLNIFGDYIIEVYLDKKLAENIEKFYQEYTKLTRENIAFFEKLIGEKYPVRMKISKNIDKAESLKKKLSKDFYLKR